MENKDMIKKPLGIRILRGILIGFGLFLLNAIFVLAPYVGIWGIIIGAVAGGLGLALSGAVLVLTYFIQLPLTISIPMVMAEYPTLMLLSGGFIIGVGGMLMTLFVWLSKYLVIGTGKYVMWHVKIIRGDDDE